MKQAKGSSHNSPAHSRRQSIAKPDQSSDARYEPPPKEPVRPEDVARERAIVKAREEYVSTKSTHVKADTDMAKRELRASLQNLSDQSLKTSRRLDDTYYSILEKVSVLRQTIGSLQELSNHTKELRDNFESDTKELVEEITGQYEGFNSFETQKEHVTALEERIKAGKKKADALTARLADARHLVESRAKAEAEDEARTTRRLHMTPQHPTYD